MRKMRRAGFVWLGLAAAGGLLGGCAATNGNTGNVPVFAVSQVEAQWIRDGEPLKFEGQLWYPQDDMEVLTDQDVYSVGEYKGVQIFIEKVDVRPYRRVYTKFDRNAFRVFERRAQDD